LEGNVFLRAGDGRLLFLLQLGVGALVVGSPWILGISLGSKLQIVLTFSIYIYGALQKLCVLKKVRTTYCYLAKTM